MASRIDNIADVPTELPEMGESVNSRLPVRFHNANKLPLDLQLIVDRLTDAIKAANQDLKALRAYGILTADDLRGIVVLTDAELSILNDLLVGDVINRLVDLENRVTVLETP